MEVSMMLITFPLDKAIDAIVEYLKMISTTLKQEQN